MSCSTCLTAQELLHILICLGLIAQIAGADTVVRSGVSPFGPRQQMVYGVSVQAAEMAGIVVPVQNKSPEILIAVKAAYGSPVHNNGGMLPYQGDRQLKINFLVPAPPLVAVSAHQDHPLVGGDQR